MQQILRECDSRHVPAPDARFGDVPDQLLTQVCRNAPMRAQTAPLPARQMKWLSCTPSAGSSPPSGVRHTAQRPSSKTTASDCSPGA